MSSRNILKAGFVNLNSDEKRIIDSNELIAQKLEKKTSEADGNISGWSGENFDVQDENGFPEDQVNDLLLDDEINQVTKNEELDEENQLEYEKRKEEMFQQVQLEIEQMKQDAQIEIEQLKAQSAEQARQEAMNQGYQDGFEQGKQQALEENEVQKEKLKKMEADFDVSIENLEPLFVEHLTSIYEHVFHVRFSDDKEIILHLLDTALHGIEGGDNYIIRISSEDYPYINMQKKKLLPSLSGATLEMVEDKTMKKGECLIETDGGIYDCSIDLELQGLSESLKLLSYRDIRKSN